MSLSAGAAEAGREALRLHQAGRLAQAAELYALVLAQQPQHADALHLLGLVRHQQGDDEAAIGLIRRAVAAGGSAPMYSNLAHILLAHQRLDEAIVCLRHALELQPDFAAGAYNLAVALLKTGNLDAAIAGYRHALSLGAQPDCMSNLLLALQYTDQISPEQLFEEHRRFSRLFEQAIQPLQQAPKNLPEPGRRLHIAYVSGDLRQHAVAYYIEPVLAHHDRKRFQVSCYHNHEIEDSVSARLKQHVDHWHNCARWSDEQLVEQIRTDGIDLLIDLSGHTAANRLLALCYRPAPVQLTWIGYPGTTGLAAVDYRLTDADADPPGLTERYHTEQLIRLPSAASFKPDADSPEVGPLPMLTGKRVTFACLNNPIKITETCVETWARVLREIPGARMVLVGVNNESVRQRLLKNFARHGIEPEKLDMHAALPLPSYLALHGSIDLALDCFPYNGGTSTYHALWMGVPVVSLAGQHTAARSGASILRRAGLERFLVNDLTEYVQLALSLARDPLALAQIRAGLRASLRMAPDTAALELTAALEAALVTAWQRWCAEQQSRPELEEAP